MSFWDLSDGGSAKDTGTEFEVPGGNMDPIPNNSDVLAQIEDVKWASKQTGERYIEARWTVLEPESLANRKVFHKMWVDGLDPSKTPEKAIQKRDRDRRMLAAIDRNAGEKLMASASEPTDDSLALALCNKPMVIKVMEYSINTNDGSGDVIRGNWVSAVKSKGAALSVGQSKAPSGAGAGGRPSSNAGGGAAFDLGGDDIPFAPEVRA